MTSREVAALAGVSEASVFYHYKDRAGLLQAVFEEGLEPLQALAARGGLAGPTCTTCSPATRTRSTASSTRRCR